MQCLQGASRRYSAGDSRTANAPGTLSMSDSLTSNQMTPAARSVLAERLRQIQREGWTPEHDDKHKNFELSLAAVSYALCAARPQLDWLTNPGRWWPWAQGWWKPRGSRRDLVRAAALIIAEIERLDRAFPLGIPTDMDTPKVNADETPAPPPLIVYAQCERHRGVAATMTVGPAPAIRTVCPICEPPGTAQKAIGANNT